LVRLAPPEVVLTAKGAQGIVVGLDGPYGNLITNLTADHVRALGYEMGDRLEIKIGKRALELPFRKSFNFVPVGSPLAYIDSKGFLAFAVNQGNFSKVYELGRGLSVELPKKE